MPTYSNTSAATTGSASGRIKTTAVMLDEYLASPPTVTENTALGRTSKDRKKKTQRGLEKWQKDWDHMGAAYNGT